jgi:chorismate mutase
MDDVISPLFSALAGDGPFLNPTDTVVAVRLATTCRHDSTEAIADAVTELVQAFHARNDVGRAMVRVAIFTATPDLRAAKPAAAARAAGWTNAQFLCLAEMPTDDDLPRCIRALLLVNRGAGADPLRPVYLNGTQALRPDLAFD